MLGSQGLRAICQRRLLLLRSDRKLAREQSVDALRRNRDRRGESELRPPLICRVGYASADSVWPLGYVAINALAAAEGSG